MTENRNGGQRSANPQTFNLRPIEVSDTDTIAVWYQQLDDVSIFDRQVPVPINHADVLTLVKTMVSDQEKEKCRWFVAENTDGDAIGMAGLEAINLLHGHAILPLFISEPSRGAGIGIRIACTMIDIAFKQLRLHRVSTVFRADNTTSEHLLGRLGFQNEGVARESWFSHGQYFDLLNVGLLKQDWENVRTTLRQELDKSVIVQLGSKASEEWCWPGRT